jgi:hypothetical protein
MANLSLVLVSGLALASVGCTKKGGANDAIAQLEELQKKMCDCKDKACADKVNEEMTKWGAEMAKHGDGMADTKPHPDVKKSADLTTKYSECMTKLMIGGAAK